ncbi:MAG: DEAD/DEAH box helicase [Mahellales bacterium]|jgi:ATP-dependent RNA helicase DeaD
MQTLKFEELNLSKEIKKAIKDIGFEEATPIQSQAIPSILAGQDIIGQAQTGTGKTAAFGIPALEMINQQSKELQVVALCPTRELAIQVAEEIRKLSKYKKGIEVLAIYGGQPIERQIRALKKGVQMVVGTPGRIIDHLNRRTIKMDNVNMVILDEADEMLDMGFVEDIEKILNRIPQQRQIVLFSATMPKPILDLTKKYQNNAKLIKVIRKQLTVGNTEQLYLEVKGNTKLEILCRLLDMYYPKLCLVFCNTKRRVDELVEQLQTRGYLADGLHGDMKQSQRDRVMNRFRNGAIEILVATDVAARGIDVDDIGVVFNYDMPQDEEYYVHRIGRTGRAGKAGRAFTFIVGREIYKLRDIQKYTKTKISLHPVPSISDVEEIKTSQFLERIKEEIDKGGLEKYLHLVEKILEDDYTSLDIAAALFKMNMLINKKEDNAHDYFEDTGATQEMTRLFINIGRNHNVSPRDIVGGIAGETGLPGKLIGTIDIFDKYTFVEVPSQYAKDVLRIMKNNEIKGKKINMEPANRR